MKINRIFELEGHRFRIIKSFSYNMAFEAFCQGYIAPEELFGKKVILSDGNELKVIEVANKTMAVPGKNLEVFANKHEYVKRTYITFIEDGQARQWWYYWQRNWRGFDASDMWNLDSRILDWLIPRLKRFADDAKGHGWPTMNGKEIEYRDGREITEQMVEGFELLKKSYDTDKDLNERGMQKVNLAFNLFKKHFDNLWT